MFSAVRIRLIAYVVGVLAIVLLAAGGAVFAVLSRQLDAAVSAQLRAAAARYSAGLVTVSRSVFSPDGAGPGATVITDTGLPPSDVNAVWTQPGGAAGWVVGLGPPAPAPPADPSTDGTFVIQWVPGRSITRLGVAPSGLPDDASVAAAIAGGDTIRTVSVDGRRYRLLTRVEPGPPGSPPVVVQAGISLAARDREQRTVLLALGGGGALGLVLTLAGAFFLTGRALAPVQLAFDRQRRFVGDASHELRTPLALLRLEAESLAGRLDDRESTRPFLRQIDRTARLVDDLLTLAQIDERALPFEPEPVHVASLVEAAAAAGRSLAPADVTVAHAAPPDAWVSGDRDRLYRVLLILVDNACRAVAAGGRIEVRARAEQSSVVIEVSDTGRGIPRDQLARVFERFYRVDRARSRAAGGAGLGLSIAHEIVRAHAGPIVLDSTPGQGATATVRLARLAAPAPLAEETGAPALV
jgi:signal transduction histidine kinase